MAHDESMPDQEPHAPLIAVSEGDSPRPQSRRRHAIDKPSCGQSIIGAVLNPRRRPTGDPPRSRKSSAQNPGESTGNAPALPVSLGGQDPAQNLFRSQDPGIVDFAVIATGVDVPYVQFCYAVNN